MFVSLTDPNVSDNQKILFNQKNLFEQIFLVTQIFLVNQIFLFTQVSRTNVHDFVLGISDNQKISD